jgi:hypothetical protein
MRLADHHTTIGQPLAVTPPIRRRRAAAPEHEAFPTAVVEPAGDDAGSA